ncbi:hypothetical protein BAUCODRAFT_377608 [Baudoinia panamericana UAMH 10762]|uniref:RanBD1 domain-containing protein n=1 Tax=Baudoinia panamericana (strain UAMH 10762) TaxID=717646 RepID=M2LVK2_BAUPA|nr:uncharacterized protein BAUCODRAFT_377608 [Baudoinia panamericana UAMH 10762]EMC98677.1 hypothetical protein BAUCODRAFT_377608 [Baudoinia panamericana UAMH 10762]
MSKRLAESQGGEERYGKSNEGGMTGSQDRAPQAATAAQLARRKIIQARGRVSARGSRAPSPATGPQQSNPFQTFQAPPAADSFTFNMQASTPTPAFGQQPAQTNGAISLGGQSNGATPIFGRFGDNQNNNSQSFSFGANGSQPQTNGFGTSNTFSFGQSQPNTNSTQPSAFSFGQQEQPKSNSTQPSSFTFGQTPSQSQERPKTNGFTGLFGASPAPPSTNKPGQSVFSGLSGSTPKPLGGLLFGQQANDTTTSNFEFGKEDTSMLSPDSTPQKPQAQSSVQAQQPATEAETPVNADSGKSIFDRLSRDPPATEPKPTFKFGAAPPSEAEPQNPNAGMSLFERMTPRDPEPPATAPRPSTSLFKLPAPSNPSGTSLFTSQAPAPPSTPGASIFQSQASAAPSAPSASLFQPQAPAPTQPAPQPVPQVTLSAPEETSTSATSSNTTLSDLSKLKSLNEGLLAHLKTEDTDKDWSIICEYYLYEAAKLIGKQLTKAPAATSAALPVTTPSAQNAMAPSPLPANTPSMYSLFGTSPPGPTPTPAVAAPSNLRGDTSQAQTPAPSGRSTYVSESESESTPKASTINIFAQAMTPKPINGASLFSPAAQTPKTLDRPKFFTSAAQPPATAPASRKRSADDELTKDTTAPEVPATEKRTRFAEPVQYPKLSDSASNTAKLFASTLDKPAGELALPSGQLKAPSSSTVSDTPSFGPSEDLMMKVREQRAAKEAAQKADAEKPKAAPGATNGWQPSSSFMFPQKPATAKASETTASPTFGSKPAETFSVPGFGFKPAETSSAPVFGVKPAETSSTPSFGFKPAGTSNPPVFGFKPTEPSAAASSSSEAAETSSNSVNGFMPSTAATAKPAETLSAPSFGFKPAAPATPATAAVGFKPATGASAADGATSFLSSFGSEANKQLEKSKRKRMDEDYDSEEEDRAAWEERDRAIQQQKMQSIAESAKAGTGFKFMPASKPASQPAISFSFGAPKASTTNGTSGDNANEDTTAMKPASDSAKFVTGFTPTPADKPASQPAVSFSFGTPTVSTGNSGLFGNNAGEKKLAPPPPAAGFLFGTSAGTSTDASRATTPGGTTDGEAPATGADGEKPDLNGDGGPSDEQTDKQVDDMTILTSKEREEHDVLFETQIAKSSKLDNKPTENGMARAWVERGKGPLYILRNKTSGKTRVLQKIAPYGKPAMNFDVLKGGKYTQNAGKKTTMASFVDHIQPDTQAPSRPSSWLITVKEIQDAQEIARILDEASH